MPDLRGYVFVVIWTISGDANFVLCLIWIDLRLRLVDSRVVRINFVKVVDVLNERNVEVVKLFPAFADLWVLYTFSTSLRWSLHQVIELRRSVGIDEATYVPGLSYVGLVLHILLISLFLRLFDFLFIFFDVF